MGSPQQQPVMKYSGGKGKGKKGKNQNQQWHDYQDGSLGVMVEHTPPQPIVGYGVVHQVP